ncbi:hypothetical protein JMA_04470 [Jeotgalibacillus malaysiensis]|uniref:Uncharacterized protein n=1 Tax=Jeotgalibacillus malaysiensis TaxID=1508404 RepID=A0A0B5AP03_9BACL|nr:hypothetical protein [Jeotgalibacillus malaysiensis]AJD89764.1 hypothetical protein JMA_04470 [Jeotgalibacillus malaysiensis]
MKVIKILGTLTIAVGLFLSGYFTHKLTNENVQEVSREVQFSYRSNEQPNQINLEKSYTDLEDQNIVDNTMMIMMHKKPSSEVMDIDHPDMYINVLSPKQHTGLVDSRVWFTESGAVIGDRVGESWDQVEYFEVNEQDADYLKEQGGFEEM